ncbi:MAG: aminoacetone oxidase family FAD-binding enzyme [Planctomycetes bacterium]|nr:aminoacetone oxidase family FAD-binding enzyme [Planctomycetota bacterium]
MSTPLVRDVVVIGAGAAGLWCAARLAERGMRVRLLEKMQRTGTKILASGGSRCNLTTTLEADEAARLFGSRGARFLASALELLPPRAVRERFHALGVPTVEAPLEKVFPRSQRAVDVRDALLRWALGSGVELVLGAAVSALEPAGESWRVHTQDGRVFEAARVVACSGGKSYPKTGTTGDGYAWLASLGLEVIEPVPALVPLTSPASWVRELTGIAWESGATRLLSPAGKELLRRERPLLFTHRGVSGPGAMDPSHFVARARAAGALERPFVLELDLFPKVSREELRARLLALAGAPGQPSVARALPEMVPRPLVRAAARAAGLAVGEELPRAAHLAKHERHALIEALKALPIPIDGTLGFDQAEVTSGGLALRELDPRSLQVNRCPGLYVCGELLDLSGPIGGLSFLSAWSTAELVAAALR